MNNKGYWCLQLHAHLPFVRHPNYPDFLEEDWLYEAITETYIPLLSLPSQVFFLSIKTEICSGRV